MRHVKPERIPAHLAAEYLATGHPVVTNRWTGYAARPEAERTRLLVAGEESCRQAAVRLGGLLADMDRAREAARSLAEREFNLEKAPHRYDGVYRQVVGFVDERGEPLTRAR